MHRHVVAHGDDFPFAIEHRARVIAPLFNVWRKCRPSQRRAHLLGNRVKEIFEDFQFNRITAHDAQCTRNRSLVASRWALAASRWRSRDGAASLLPRYIAHERPTTDDQRPTTNDRRPTTNDRRQSPPVRKIPAVP